MDSMSTAELLETGMTLISMQDMQFQYWLGITFALIVASFTAGNRLSLKIRSVIAFLFLCSAMAFFNRYIILNSNIGTFINEAITRGVPWTSPTVIFSFGSIPIDSGTFRMLVMFIGTLTTVWFLYSNANLSRIDKEIINDEDNT